MFQNTKPFLAVSAILAGLSFFPLALPSSFSINETLDPRFKEIPYQIGEWTGKDLLLDDQTYQILETKNVLSRFYQNPTNQETVHLLLVGSNKDRRVAHPPEVCYTSSHFDLISSKENQYEVSGRTIPVRQFLAEDQNNPNHKEFVLYTYQIGDKFTSNYYAQQLQFTFDHLTRKESEILLIRLSASSEKSFGQFLPQILPHISSSLASDKSNKSERARSKP